MLRKIVYCFLLAGSAALADHELPPLHQAAADGQVERVRELLAAGARVNAVTETNWTPLHAAVAGGHVEVCRLLLAAGANVHVRDNEGRTMLANMLPGSGAEMVRLLVAAGANPNAVDDVLWTVACRGMAEAYDALISAGGKLTRGTPLHVAALLNRAEECGALIDAGADVEAQVELSGFPRSLHELQCCTPLHLAAKMGGAEACAKLLAMGANPNARDARGRTPLHLSASPSVCRMLLRAGADAAAKDFSGKTPADLAADFKREAVLFILQKK